MKPDKTSINLCLYYVAIFFLAYVLAVYPFHLWDNIPEKYIDVTSTYDFSFGDFSIRRVLGINNGVYLALQNEENGEISIYNLKESEGAEEIFSFQPSCKRCLGIEYSAKKNIFLIYSSDDFRGQILEAVSFSGEKIWEYSFWGGMYSMTFHSPDGNQIFLNTERNGHSSKAVILDLNGMIISENKFEYPNFQVIGETADGFVLGVEQNGGIIMKVSRNFDVIWRQNIPKYYNFVSSFYNDKIYTTKGFLDKRSMIIYDGNTGKIEKKIHIGKLPAVAAKLRAPVVADDGDIFVLYHGYYGNEAITSGVLKIDSQGKSFVIVPDCEKTVPNALLYSNETVFVSSSQRANGFLEKVFVCRIDKDETLE